MSEAGEGSGAGRRRSRWTSLSRLVSAVQAVGSQAVQGAKAAGTAAVASAKVVTASTYEKGKASLSMAAEELKTKTQGATVKGASSLSNLQRPIKGAAGVAARGVKAVGQLAVQELGRYDVRHPMDCSVEAGAGLVVHYQTQWAALRQASDGCAAVAKTAHARLVANKNSTRATTERVATLHTKLSELPEVMETLATSVSVLGRLKTGLDSVEAALDELEALYKTRAAEQRLNATVQGIVAHEKRQAAALKREKGRAKADFNKARQMLARKERDLARSADMEAVERQAAYQELFDRQMEHFRKHHKTDYIAHDRSESASEAHLLMQEIPTVEGEALDPGGISELNSFLVEEEGDGEEASGNVSAAVSEPEDSEPSTPIAVLRDDLDVAEGDLVTLPEGESRAASPPAGMADAPAPLDHVAEEGAEGEGEDADGTEGGGDGAEEEEADSGDGDEA